MSAITSRFISNSASLVYGVKPLFKETLLGSRSHALGVKGVIFDWAGTTIDYGCKAPMAVFRKVFAEEGVPISVAEARAPMGVHKKVHIRKITQLPAVAERWMKVYSRPPNETDIEKMYAKFVPQQLECLANYCDLIPGTLETVKFIRDRKWKIGTTTGYTYEMKKILLSEAKKRGYSPDSMVTADGVQEGRPFPFMVRKSCDCLDLPLFSTVKVDDTPDGVIEGVAAGTWGVHLFQTGNEVGLTEEELNRLPQEEKQRLLQHAAKSAAGVAHFIIPGIWELPRVLMEIDMLIKTGHSPDDYPEAHRALTALR